MKRIRTSHWQERDGLTELMLYIVLNAKEINAYVELFRES